MRLLSYVLGLVLAMYLCAILALFLMQDRMLLPSTPDAADLRSLPHAGEDIELWKAHGEYAGYIVAPVERRARGTFIVYHGNAESAETKLPLADVFVRNGYRVVVVEYPGHGNRAGARTMKAALTASREALAGALAQWGGPVFLVGESLGAGMASQVTKGNETAVAGVVLITPWDSLAEVAAEKYPFLPVRWLLHDPFDSVAALSHFDGPLVIVGAQQDTLIPVLHARRLVSEHKHSHLLVLPTADHDNWFRLMRVSDWREILALLRAG
ncbi:Alpha/beta hydrolase family protein [Caballeronia catudaia]|uniref:Alpha/beta hydrolase family protein n=1 Tax=Caballeronia catudaia TaxID=1777136 RepID=A0A158C7G5_9BURK|nr:alpha/beta fold hydrolase [Caballeronia catudaia]SAK78211.1 Alpha/beta hydrolase family protein [Caballeronia catudaia]